MEWMHQNCAVQLGTFLDDSVEVVAQCVDFVVVRVHAAGRGARSAVRVLDRLRRAAHLAHGSRAVFRDGGGMRWKENTINGCEQRETKGMKKLLRVSSSSIGTVICFEAYQRVSMRATWDVVDSPVVGRRILGLPGAQGDQILGGSRGDIGPFQGWTDARLGVSRLVCACVLPGDVTSAHEHGRRQGELICIRHCVRTDDCAAGHG